MEIIQVNESKLDFVLRHIKDKQIGIDTETTGKRFHDKPFCLTIATGGEVFYIDLEVMQRFEVCGSLIFSHNAKFDLMMLQKRHITVSGEIHCTMVCERILRNDFMEYSLAATAKRYGLHKDEALMEYVREHGLYEVHTFMGEVMDRSPQFHKVPKDILVKYATTDARLHLEIGKMQREKLETSI